MTDRASPGPPNAMCSQSLDRHVELTAWMPGRRRALLKVYDETSGPLYFEQRAGAPRSACRSAPSSTRTSTRCRRASRNGTIVFTGTEAGRAIGTLLSGPGATAPRRLTDFNAAYRAACSLGRVDDGAWDNGRFSRKRRADVSAQLRRNAQADPSHVFPLVLRIHGGPLSTSEAMFEPFYQFAASHGYLVFAPNYRGSSDPATPSSTRFRRCQRRPREPTLWRASTQWKNSASSTRIALGVSGWSYGGQLTSWMIGHYQIWKCAVTGAAVNDLVVDYTIADDIDADRVSFPRRRSSATNSPRGRLNLRSRFLRTFTRR